MFNLRIDKKEYETLIDMCSMSLMTASHAGAEGEHYNKMIAMFNTLVEMSHDRSEVITDDRLNLIQDKYFFPACMTFYKNMTKDDIIATDVSVVEDETIVAQVIR